VTAGAAAGLERCRRFLANKNPLAARRASEAIEQRFGLLETHPEIGRPDLDEPELRELLIPFGDSGYVALYRFVAEEDSVLILAFRHQKELGY
jgi:plasmid stabilization system protein ParE